MASKDKKSTTSKVKVRDLKPQKPVKGGALVRRGDSADPQEGGE